MNERPLKGDGSKPYLGAQDVVHSILADVVGAALEEPDRLLEAIQQATAALSGEDDGYQPVDDWNREAIGDWIRENMAGVPHEGGARSAVEYAVAHLALHALEAVKAVSEGAIMAQKAGENLSGLLRSWTALMLGISPAAADAGG